MIDEAWLQRLRAGEVSTLTPATLAELAAELLSLRQENARLKQRLATEVKLPYTAPARCAISKRATPQASRTAKRRYAGPDF